jgi:hypothetical protein
VPAPLYGVEMDVVWLSHGLQRVALVAGLRTALSAAALAQIVRAGLLQSVAARRLAAVTAVFPQVVLKGFNPCLEVEDEGSQLPHQGPYGFFTPQVGGMDIFWGRQASWCHAVYCARFLAVLHQGMMNFLVCLSSNIFMTFFCPAVGDQGSMRLYLVRVSRGIILMPSRRKISSRASKT